LEHWGNGVGVDPRSSPLRQSPGAAIFAESRAAGLFRSTQEENEIHGSLR